LKANFIKSRHQFPKSCIMIFSRAWYAIMRRNIIYRRRNWIGTVRRDPFVIESRNPSSNLTVICPTLLQILEIVLPFAFVAVLVGIKSGVGSAGGASSRVEPVIPDDSFAFVPLSFGDYVTALQAKRQCFGLMAKPDMSITGMPNQAENWQVPLVKCDSRKCEKDGQDAQSFCEYAIVALAGSDEGGRQRATDMKRYILDRFPILEDPDALPFDYDLVQLFDSTDDMDRYVKRVDYGNKDVPKIAMGIVWDGNDPQSYVYSLRQNSTNFNNPSEEDYQGSSTTPSTGKSFDSFATSDASACEPLDGTPSQGPLEASCTGQYLYNGVLTFQRLVGDFILNRTGAEEDGYFVAEAGVHYVPFPTRAYKKSGFFGDLAGKCRSQTR
jgi:hypothetical protein